MAARVTTEGVILVDDKFERNHAEIMQRVRSVTDRPITYVLGTHHHGDHMGGNLLISRHAQIISHRNVRVNMVRNDHLAPPEIIFSDRAAIFLGGVESERTIWDAVTPTAMRLSSSRTCGPFIPVISLLRAPRSSTMLRR